VCLIFLAALRRQSCVVVVVSRKNVSNPKIQRKPSRTGVKVEAKVKKQEEEQSNADDGWMT